MARKPMYEEEQGIDDIRDSMWMCPRYTRPSLHCTSRSLDTCDTTASLRVRVQLALSQTVHEMKEAGNEMGMKTRKRGSGIVRVVFPALFETTSIFNNQSLTFLEEQAALTMHCRHNQGKDGTRKDAASFDPRSKTSATYAGKDNTGSPSGHTKGMHFPP
ncbi:hypothetical protein BJ508DRAFT_337807 [Ascobolus immersus RN42]|uniref:Uncharacterized protein n=1 Tax=Ascobolus immersus RN42 TaxID=1160509 RepID=A0A3N4HWV7_ASCIM|nr:hypothetical protein BJ508DRAFT_337807 [Ascobolus immersus RN42]